LKFGRKSEENERRKSRTSERRKISEIEEVMERKREKILKTDGAWQSINTMRP